MKVFFQIIFIYLIVQACAPESLNITTDGSNISGQESEADDGDGFEQGKSSTQTTGASLLTYENADTSCSLSSSGGQSSSVCIAMAGDQIADSVEEGLTLSWDNPIDQATSGEPAGLFCSLSDLKLTQSCVFSTPQTNYSLGFGLSLSLTNNNGVKSKSISSVVIEEVIFQNRLAAGGQHACRLMADNTLKCWGRNAYGQLGLENSSDMGSGASQMGSNLNAINLGAGLYPVQIELGYHFSCAVLNNQSVKCWGVNGFGGLGKGNIDWLGDGASEMGNNLLAIDLGTGRSAKFISAGGDSTCAILNNDDLKCWGFNNYGQAGQGHVDAIGDDPNEMGDNLPVVNLGTGKKIKIISVSTNGPCAILNDDSLKCWGENSAGALGYGDTNSRGELGGQMGDSLPVVDLGTGRTALAVARSDGFACALLDNYSVKCWGENTVGQLGQEDTNNIGDIPNQMGDNLPAIDLGTGRTALQISAGVNHACALLDNYTVKCWGSGGSGECGQGTISSIGSGANEMGDNLPAIDLGTGKTAKEVVAGDSFTCAVLNDDSVKCWGKNTYGALGQGHTSPLGDGPNEMGDNLFPIDL